MPRTLERNVRSNERVFSWLTCIQIELCSGYAKQLKEE